MTSDQLIHIRISHVCWWLEPSADLVIALRAWRLLADAVALRLLMLVMRYGLRFDGEPAAYGGRRHG